MNSNSAETIKLMLYWQRKALKPSQRKRPRIVQMTYPLAAEKKYALMLRTWMKPLMDFTTDFIRQNGEDLIRGDAAMELVIRCDALPEEIFTMLLDSLKGWLATYVPDVMKQWPDDGPAIWLGLGQAAEDLNEANYRQWQKSSKSAMGVAFPKDEDWWPGLKKRWQEQNYTLIKKLDTEYITRINSVTEQAVVNAWSVRHLMDEIKKIDSNMTDTRAYLIARDQIGKLNSMASQARMQHAGLNMYIWDTAHDERVRGNPGGKYPNALPSHYLMDSLLCRLDDPTVYSADDGKKWITRPAGAPLVHPGMDINCRCVMGPYWEELMGEVDLKIAKEEEPDALSAANTVAMPKATSSGPPPAAAPEPGNKTAKPVKQGVSTMIGQTENSEVGKEAESAINSELSELREWGKENKREQASMMMQDGKTIGSAKGKKNKVVLSKKMSEALGKQPPNSLVLLHNHPDSTSFSITDFDVICSYKSINELRVIGSNGKTYRISIGNGERPSPVEMKQYEKEIEVRIKQGVANKMVKRQLPKGENAWSAYLSERNAAFAKKYGWIYEEGKLDG
jgi:hypothetical protein